MKKNLAAADNIVKLVLASSAIIAYFSKVIAGPVAQVLMILSALVIVLYVAKVFVSLITRD